MSRYKRIFTILAMAAPLGVAAVATSTTPNLAVAAELAPDLCIATGIDLWPGDDTLGQGGCEYAPWDAPKLEAEVCWDGSIATLKGSAPCAGYGRTYLAQHGEVIDPEIGLVTVYAPLPNSCWLVPCAPMYEAIPIDDGVACCDPEAANCTSPDADGMCSQGDITWCKELETHNDGSVTCHE